MVSLQSLNFATEAATDNKQMARHGCVPNIFTYKKGPGPDLTHGPQFANPWSRVQGLPVL